MDRQIVEGKEQNEPLKLPTILFPPVAPSILHDRQFNLFICRTKTRRTHSISPKKLHVLRSK